MTTELVERPIAKNGTLMSVTEETIAQMAARFGALKINGINDKAGFLAVDNARKECMRARGVISTEHATLKADALKVCQTLDAMKRNLTSKVEEIETPLKAAIAAVEAEKARIQKAKDDAVYADRVSQLASHGATIAENVLRAMSPDEFAKSLAWAIDDEVARKEAAAKAEAEEVERKRVAAEQAEANRKEAERLAAERAEFQRQQAIEEEKRAAERAQLEAQRLEQERKAAELQAEQDRLAKIEADRIAAEQQKQREADAAERARIETEQRLKREAEVEEAERVAKAAAEKRLLELQPAKSKLNLLASTVMNLEVPSGLSDFVENQVQMVLNTAAESIRRIGANLS